MTCLDHERFKALSIYLKLKKKNLQKCDVTNTKTRQIFEIVTRRYLNLQLVSIFT